MEDQQGSVEGAVSATAAADSGGLKPKGRRGLLFGIALACVIALVVAGVYLFRTSPALGGDPIPEFKRVMDEQSGFECQDDNPGNFERKSDFTLDSSDPKEMSSGGFVTLIEYQDEDAARVGQDKWSQNTSQQAGFEETESDGIRIVSSRNSDDVTPEVYRGTGVLGVQFGKYRFESHGDRDKLDDIVDELGYLDPERTYSDPFPQFVKAVQASGMTSQTAVAGYARRSSYKDGDFVTECRVYWDQEAADKDLKEILKYVKDMEKDENGGTWKVSRGRGIWWVREWTGEDGEDRDYYVVRVYSGKAMIAASAPLKQRKEVDELMRELTK